MLVLLAFSLASAASSAADCAAAGGPANDDVCHGAPQEDEFEGTSLMARRVSKSLTSKPLEEASVTQVDSTCSFPNAFAVDRSALAVSEDSEATAYSTVTVSDAKALAKKFARPAPYNDFIFTTFQGSNAFVRFWYSHLAAVGAQQQALMLTFAPEDCKGLPRQSCVVHELGDMLRTMHEDAVPKSDGGQIQGGALAVVSKWVWAHAFAEAGYNVIFSDSDVAFVKNPFDYWWGGEPRKFDVMGLSDWRAAASAPNLPYCTSLPQPRHLKCQSTGIMFFRSNPRVTSVLADMVGEAAPPGRIWEQELWQKYIPRLVDEYKGTYTLLPVASFMNEEYVSSNTAQDKAVAVHMGYVGGACLKMEKFQCLGLGVKGLEGDARAMCGRT